MSCLRSGQMHLMTDVPKIIYSLWFSRDGIEIPPTSKACFEQWLKLNPEYDLRILGWQDVENILDGFPVPLEKMTPQAISDLVRIHVLAKAGGVWVDASVFPLCSLSSWLPAKVADTGFFAFERPAKDRPVASWFIAAAPRNFLIQRWLEEVQRYWFKPRSLLVNKNQKRISPRDTVFEVSPEADEKESFPYFWFHYLFEYLLHTRPEFKRSWEECEKISGVPPHTLQNLCMHTPQPTEEQIADALSGTYLQKLNWRMVYPLAAISSVTVPI